jgi:hypothetical protein
MEDFALRQKSNPRALHRRLLGLWSPFNNSSTVTFNPSATLINVLMRGQCFPVSRNRIPVRLNPERCRDAISSPQPTYLKQELFYQSRVCTGVGIYTYPRAQTKGTM